MSIDYRHVIAETPYDQMGAEFQDTFGNWVNDKKLQSPNELNQLAFELFRLRLALAQKYNTFFAKQVTAGGKELWKERFAGVGNTPCYSFATNHVDRTKRFYKWTLLQNDRETMNASRHWDTDYAAHPSFPISVFPFDCMSVWAHRYDPRFTARTGGPFECRRMFYGIESNTHDPIFLFEHPRSRWISQIRAEATTFWNIAFDANNDQFTRFSSLASFEWLWNWANPFMRSGALTSDALSLVMQKKIGAKTRTFFYHQDCEALLLPFDQYVTKRVNDMTYGFVEHFSMQA